ncbi:MAG: DNA-directed RNA polymerase subunit omega [Clostridia bacterium]|nr:DNA-directed RNA polymerase subunit omega [Clostridia bacterium]
MVDPNVMELLDHADTRYTLVVEASRRGRELVDGAMPMIDDVKDKKPLRIAIEEIDRGLVTYDRAVAGAENTEA